MSNTAQNQGTNSGKPKRKVPEGRRFKPGVSGNPGGRPKGRSITAKLRELLESGEGKADLSKRMATTAYKMAMKGDFRFWNAIVERLDGKVADKIDLGGEVTVFKVNVPGVELDDERG